jgi:hypothetical protein
MITEGSKLDAISAGNCPECGKRGFVIGPIAGGGGRAMSTTINIECASLDCRARFNATFISSRVIWFHDLPRASDGGVPWESEPRN